MLVVFFVFVVVAVMCASFIISPRTQLIPLWFRKCCYLGHEKNAQRTHSNLLRRRCEMTKTFSHFPITTPSPPHALKIIRVVFSHFSCECVGAELSSEVRDINAAATDNKQRPTQQSRKNRMKYFRFSAFPPSHLRNSKEKLTRISLKSVLFSSFSYYSSYSAFKHLLSTTLVDIKFLEEFSFFQQHYIKLESK